MARTYVSPAGRRRAALRNAFAGALEERQVPVEENKENDNGIDTVVVLREGAHPPGSRSVYLVDWTKRPPEATVFGPNGEDIDTIRACVAEAWTEFGAAGMRQLSEALGLAPPRTGMPRRQEVVAEVLYEAVRDAVRDEVHQAVDRNLEPLLRAVQSLEARLRRQPDPPPASNTKRAKTDD